MSSDANRTIAQCIFDEVLSNGRMELVDELVAPDHVAHGLPPSMPGGLKGLKMFFHYFRTAFPDVQHAIHDQIAERDRVVSRITATGTHSAEFMGIPATGRNVVMDGIVINRFSDGRIVETWALYDDLTVLKQIKGLPASTSLPDTTRLALAQS